mgnify:CR=1 FL=1|tara:strand:+ start:13405 stop:14661 length:1257 start_codon:yes stop_codon:yes gene_type:complete
MKTRLLVRGPALSQSGYGEQARFALRALRTKEENFDIYLQNIPWGNTGWICTDDEERAWIDQLIIKTETNKQSHTNYDVSLQITIPNEWNKVAPINIGYTAGIETTMVAPQWIGLGDQMDHIIVVSNHSKDVYQDTKVNLSNESGTILEEDVSLKTPITVVNFPTRIATSDLKDLSLSTDFNFLTIAQWGPRKNLEKSIKCFVEEFMNEEVGLVVKTNVGKNNKIDRENTRIKLKQLLQKFPDRKCKVYLLHGVLSEEELSGLYQHPKIKAYVSITHGEGFGLPLFEAACYGLPVISPVWSGQCDFLNMPSINKNGKEKIKTMCAKVDYELKPIGKEAVWEGVLDKNSSWAYPSYNSYKNKLRDVYKDQSRYKSQAKRLQTWVLDNFSQEQKYEEFVSCILETIASEKDGQAQEVMVL